MSRQLKTTDSALDGEILPPETTDTVSQVTEVAPPLNPRHKLFAEKYITERNGTAAAIAAGYSPRSAGVEACRLLKRTDVAEYVAHLRARATASAEITATQWREELAGIAFSSIMDFVDTSDGTARIDLTRATPEQARALQSFKTRTRVIRDARNNVVGEETSVEVKLWDKLRALELIGKHSGFLEEPEQRVVIDVADRLLAARQRVLRVTDGSTDSADSGTST